MHKDALIEHCSECATESCAKSDPTPGNTENEIRPWQLFPLPVSLIQYIFTDAPKAFTFFSILASPICTWFPLTFSVYNPTHFKHLFYIEFFIKHF